MQTTRPTRPTRTLLALALGAVTLLGGSSLVASAQAAPDITITDEAACDGPNARIQITFLNNGDVALGVNVVLDDETVDDDVTIEPGTAFSGNYPYPGVGATIQLQTTNDALVLAEAEVVSEEPVCDPLTDVVLEPACDGTDPILNILLSNDGDVDQGVNVYLDDEPIATDLTIPTDAIPVLAVPYPAVGAVVDVVSSNDELFFGGAEVTDPAPDCSTTTTTGTDTDPQTVTPPAAKPIAGRASYTG